MARPYADFAPDDGAVRAAERGRSDYDKLLIAYLERISLALEEANRLNSPAHEINSFNAEQLRAATGKGGLIQTAAFVPQKKNN
jgi:hypothetical protein